MEYWNLGINPNFLVSKWSQKEGRPANDNGGDYLERNSVRICLISLNV